MTTDLSVPDEAWWAFSDIVGHANPPDFDLDRGRLAAVATPVVVAELLALAGKVAALHGNGGPTYRDGWDAAIGAVRELIADRCDELGTRVEDL